MGDVVSCRTGSVAEERMCGTVGVLRARAPPASVCVRARARARACVSVRACVRACVRVCVMDTLYLCSEGWPFLLPWQGTVWNFSRLEILYHI